MVQLHIVGKNIEITPAIKDARHRKTANTREALQSYS